MALYLAGTIVATAYAAAYPGTGNPRQSRIRTNLALPQQNVRRRVDSGEIVSEVRSDEIDPIARAATR
jgi:hypothetical protein